MSRGTPTSALGDDGDTLSRLFYRCLSCGYPSPQYYSVLSASSSSTKTSNNIQLTECKSCGSIVDHYFEREVLLLVLDLILLRQAAYRHVYWNRLQVQTLKVDWNSRFVLSVVVMAATIATTEISRDGPTWSMPRFLPSFSAPGSSYLSTVLMIVMVLLLYGWMWIFIRNQSMSQEQIPQHERATWKMVHCAIWFPLLGGGLLGMVIAGIWTPVPANLQDPFYFQLVEDIGLAALMGLWQISGLRVMVTNFHAVQNAPRLHNS